MTGVEDEVLDLDSMDQSQRSSLTGEGALLAAVGAHRTGRMGDIVATIQAEQDRVIRSDLAGPLVVQGGPGTGKTAVALHRAAYLLYTHRERLARSGVLIVGPNPLFLRYIEQVLPVARRDRRGADDGGRALPRGRGGREREPDVAALKGDLRMAAVLGARRAGPRSGCPTPRGCWPWAASGSTLTPADVAARPGAGPAQPQAAQPGPRGVPPRPARRAGRPAGRLDRHRR